MTRPGPHIDVCPITQADIPDWTRALHTGFLRTPDVSEAEIAAEYPIYGRHGFGPATWSAQWTVDVPRTGLDPRWAGPEKGGRIDIVDGADVRKIGPELYERVRRAQPGAVDRDGRWWQINTGALHLGRVPWIDPFFAVYRSSGGEVEGLVSYTADDHWGDGKQPLNTATVNWLVTSIPDAERAVASSVLDRLDHDREQRLAGPRRPVALPTPGPAGRPDHDAQGLVVGADPGCRTGSGGADVRGGRVCWCSMSWTRRGWPVGVIGWR